MGSMGRLNFHQERARAAHSAAESCGEPHTSIRLVEAALHELGVTFTASVVDKEQGVQQEIEDMMEGLERVRVAAEAHAHAITRANRGEAPWGEILGANAALKAALEAVLGPGI